MKNALWLTVAAVGAVIFAISVSAAGIKEGKWSMSMTIQAEGMGNEAAQAMRETENMSADQLAMMQRMMGNMGIGMSGQGMTINTSQCMTNDNPVPRRSDDSPKCQEKHTQKGNTVHFEITCPDSTSTGQVVYQNESMQGTIKTTKTEHGRSTDTTLNISGQYQGPC